MRVIGTAGHVDHGKSTLIAALTGVHPDRLKEEQEREMTIDLGFGWLTLPDGEELGIVDVPGHRDFIENMLAGVGGIDAALLVIAADEGVMPQTREHLAILDLLQIPAGVIALTKIDLAPDPAWLDLLEADVRAALHGTILQDAPCVRVSARTRQGLDRLLETLQTILSGRAPRPDLGRPRLPVDRVFSMPGFGAVVTGTLLDGHFSIGDEVEILPGGLAGRVRGLQTHRKKESTAQPGSRTAVNISGIETDQLQRGQVVAHPGQYQASRRLDARLRRLKDSASVIKHGDEVKFFIGASESMGTVRLLGVEELAAGQEGWIQLELKAPVVAIRGDRYILRRPSPGETLGGGAIVDGQPSGRHKRFEAEILKSLDALMQGTPSEVLLEASLALHAAPIRELVSRSRLGAETAELALQELFAERKLIALEAGPPLAHSDLLVISLPDWNDLHSRTLQILDPYHQNFPLRRGMPREELKNKLRLAARVFNAFVKNLVSQNTVIEKGSLIARSGHQVNFDSGQQSRIQALLEKFSQSPHSPPGFKECQAEIGEELLHALIESGALVAVSPEVLYLKEDYDRMVAQVRQAIQEKGRITLAEVRDLFDTSRKYAQALLEHLDAAGLTVRDGDFRKLRS